LVPAVLGGIVSVVTAKALRSSGHQLHQPHGAGVRFRIGDVSRLLPDDGMNESRIDSFTLGSIEDQSIDIFVSRRWDISGN
jgi:hypothetical protein